MALKDSLERLSIEILEYKTRIKNKIYNTVFIKYFLKYSQLTA
jgi:hypothetical protein